MSAHHEIPCPGCGGKGSFPDTCPRCEYGDGGCRCHADIPILCERCDGEGVVDHDDVWCETCNDAVEAARLPRTA
jgi:hypothetical protein